jgi:D-amino peptidase
MDAEGISGIYQLGQVMPGHPEYEFARRMMASDINAAARGAFNAGADEVIVNDAHNAGNNLLIDQLDPRIVLISGNLRPLSMAEGIEQGADAALLVGYHRRKGAKGCISHSYAYGSMVEMKLNGRLIGEHDLIGHCIGCFGTPVIFLSGDDLTAADARESVPGIYTVETKRCINNGAAMCYHPQRNAKLIEARVEVAVRNYKKDGIRPMRVEGRVELDVRYSAELQAARAAWAQNTERLDENTVRYAADDYMSVYKAFQVGTALASAFRDDADLYR